MTASATTTTDTERSLRVLVDAGATFEVRALGAERGRKVTLSGYFVDAATAAQHVTRSTSGAHGVYFTLNPVRPELWARRADRIAQADKGETTGDQHIVRRTRLLIDIDAERPSGISASNVEHDAALVLAAEVALELVARGWPEPLRGDSGNGAHLVFAIDLPTNDEGLVARVLAALQARWGCSVDGVTLKIDTTVANPARISKLYGTWTRKGDNIPERPHRLSKIIATPDRLSPVSRALLESLAAEFAPAAPAAKNKTAAPANGPRPMDVGEWLARHAIEVRSSSPWQGGTMHELGVCPFNGDHDRGEAHVEQHASGAISAGCHHESCKWTWQDLRARYEDMPSIPTNGARVSHREPPSEVVDADRDVMPPNLSFLPPRNGHDLRAPAVALDESTLAIASHDDEPVDLRDAKLCPRLDAYFGDDEPDEDDSGDWNIRDIVPREPTLWGGRQKGGKTWAALDLSIAMALGVDWLGFQNTRGVPIRVLGIFIEDGKKRFKRRLWELCRGRGLTPNDERLREHLSITRELIRLPEDARSIAKRLKGWGPQVVIIDNLTRVMVGDPNSTRDAAAFNKAWLQLGDELGAGIMMLHHTRKTNDEKKGGGGADPFDALRGSGDFGAAARHLIVSKPIDVDGAVCSEVHMRGNLDLRSESFALGFERTIGADGRRIARVTNRGDVNAVRAAAGDRKRAAKDEQKKRDSATEMERRRGIALSIVRTKGACSTYDLGVALEMTDKGAAPILKALELSGVLKRDKARGYVFRDNEPEPSTQTTLPVPG